MLKIIALSHCLFGVSVLGNFHCLVFTLEIGLMVILRPLKPAMLCPLYSTEVVRVF